MAPLTLVVLGLALVTCRVGRAAASGSAEAPCPEGQFACWGGNIKCIPLNLHCDGQPSCEDRSDELDCKGPTEGTWIYQSKDRLAPKGLQAPSENSRTHSSSFSHIGQGHKKCPQGWHYYDGTASCYRAFGMPESYWEAVQQCQKAGGYLAMLTSHLELHYIISQEWGVEWASPRREQGRFWVGYQYIVTNHSKNYLEGHWQGAPVLPPTMLQTRHEVVLPPSNVPTFSVDLSEHAEVLCGQLQCFHFPNLHKHALHGWYADNCDRLAPYLCKRDKTCMDIRDGVVEEGQDFTPRGNDPCLTCTCHRGEAEACVAALCERPQACQRFQIDPRECCKFTCLDPAGGSFLDGMASGMRLIVSCISSFLILSLLLFMVHRLRQRRREHIESLIGANLHHLGLGRGRIHAFDYGPESLGTGFTPLHLSDDGEGEAFQFAEPPPPYTAYKSPDFQPPDDPPPPYELAVNNPPLPADNVDGDVHACSAANQTRVAAQEFGVENEMRVCPSLSEGGVASLIAEVHVSRDSNGLNGAETLVPPELRVIRSQSNPQSAGRFGTAV
uniref:integral membrane protein DGCR2/IDD isoform X1 n=1 Tax=Myxine glutinosa TaxID=7769 RepID=UPI00358E5436